jgi:cysteine desulfurase / selenocysteine lyase
MAGRDIAVRKLRMPAGGATGIVTFRHRQMKYDALFARLKSNDAVYAVRSGDMRFSPHCHTPLQQLDQAVAITAG